MTTTTATIGTAALAAFAIAISEPHKENIVPRMDKLIRLRHFLDTKISDADAQRLHCNDRAHLIALCMLINVNTYAPGAVIDLRHEPDLVYYRVCQNCHTAADVHDPDDHSVRRYLCSECGSCLVIDHPLYALDDVNDAAEELMEIQRVNAGGDVFLN